MRSEGPPVPALPAKTMGPQKRRKYRPVNEHVFVRLTSVSRNLASASDMIRRLECIFSAAGVEPIGYLGRRSLLEPIPPGGLEALFSMERGTMESLQFHGTRETEATITWFPPAEFDGFFAQALRVNVGLALGKGWEWDSAEELFLTAVEQLSPYWGELNFLSATRKPTLCDQNGHYSHVPHLGSANYFGAEYCAWWGGVEKLENGGFERVQRVSSGAYVVLTRSGEPAEYLARRAEVEGELASPEVFDANARVAMPKFEV